MPQSPTLRRLMRESRELSPNPPAPILPNPTFHAAPLSSNLHEWHFTLLGPPSTPYAGGMYHGRIVLPSTYPLRPPSFRFLTPSGRFEVNREICLSISGFHEETWQPAWGVRLALTALRVFMIEEGKGQIGGLEANETVRKQLAERSRQWRCAGCETGGKTNEEIMKEWWDCCRAKGVQVGEDGEAIEGTGATETIPEELRLGYRDELGKKDATEKNAVENTEQSPQASSESTSLSKENASPSTTTAEAPATLTKGPDVLQSQPQLVTQSEIHPSSTPVQTPSPNSQSTTSIQKVATSQSTPAPSTTQSVSSQPSSSSVRMRNTAHSEPPPRQSAQLDQLEQVSTPYLDKAISGVIIALVLILLKKMFV